MSSIRIEFESAGFKELLGSAEVKALVSEQVDQVRERANAIMGPVESEGFYGRTVYGGFGGGRWVGFVGTTDRATMIAASENKALEKAVSG